MLRQVALRGAGAARGLRAGPARLSFGSVPAQQLRSFHGSMPTRKQEEEAALGPSLMEKYQLDEPSRYVPLTVGGFGLATMTGLYQFDAESQLLVLWVLFCGTIYSQAGPAIGEYFDEMADEIETEHLKVEQAEIEAAKVHLAAHKEQTLIFNDIKGLFDSQLQVIDNLVESTDNELKHQVREQYVKRLDGLVAMENKVSDENKKAMISKAISTVTSAYSGDQARDLKANALNAALTALSNPVGAKKDDTVGKLYSAFFADANKKLHATKGKPVKLSAEELKEGAEVAEAFGRREGLDFAGMKPEDSVVLKI